MNHIHLIKEIVSNKEITTWYQPIVDLVEMRVHGWEALTRGPSISPLHSPAALFGAAEEAGCVKALEKVCVENAARSFTEQSLNGKLFVNLSQEVLIAGSKVKEHIAALVDNTDINPQRIVIEITEHSSSGSMKELIKAILVFHELGFEIAIDDLGAGYSSLQLWSEVKPDYVKIDRHFINNIDSDVTKQEFVRSILAIAKSVNSKVIAEGMETYEEFEALKNIGIELYQGYAIQRPQLNPKKPILEKFQRRSNLNNDEISVARDIIYSSEAVDVNTRIHDVVKKFQKQVALTSLAVLKNKKVMGMVHRTSFLTEMSRPFAMDLSTKKSVTTVMNNECLRIDANIRLEQVSRLVTGRARIHAEEDFVITEEGNYIGTAHVIDLLRQITEIQVNTARHANPLTMLPGNIPIGDCVNSLLRKEKTFTITYLDLDNFKPFNDYYGYAKGDEVLMVLAELMKKYIHHRNDFIGHIGGDDFIAVTQNKNWRDSLCSVVKEFDKRIIGFYSKEDTQRGGIQAIDRHGDKRFFGFVRISIGAMQVSAGHYHSFQEVSKELVKLKHQAKNSSNINIAYKVDGQLELITFNDQKTETVLKSV